MLAGSVTPMEFSERVHLANRNYGLAKRALDSLLQSLLTCPDGIAATEDMVPVLCRLAMREESTLCEMAEALQALYDHDQRSAREEFRPTMCA